MLNIQTGLKYRQKIEQKLSLAARQPTTDLCDIDSLEEEVFQDKNATEIVNEVLSHESNDNVKRKKKEKKKRKKDPSAKGNNRRGADIFHEILNGDSDDE